MESKESEIQHGNEGVGEATAVACQTTPLVGNHKRIAVVLSFNLTGSIVQQTTPVFCFTDPNAFTEWVTLGEYLDFANSPLDLPFYYTLH